MMKTVSYVVLLTVLVNCAHTPKYARYERGEVKTISSRVGDVVDVKERDEFDLFRGVDGFESAKFYAIRGGGYEVQIVTKNGTLLAINGDSLAVEILRDYIDRYDEVVGAREEFERKWHIIAYDDMGQPITSHELKKIKDPIARTIGLACFLGGGLAGGFIGYAGSFNLAGDGSSMPLILGVMGGAIVSGGAGMLLGGRYGERVALKQIRNARRPVAME